MKRNTIIVICILMIFSAAGAAADGFWLEDAYGSWKSIDWDGAQLEMNLSEGNTGYVIRQFQGDSDTYRITWDWYDGLILVEYPEGNWFVELPYVDIYRMDWVNEVRQLVNVWDLEVPENYTTGFVQSSR